MPSLGFEAKDDVSDLLFQINRSRPSAVDANIRLNRLMKWSVAAIQPLTVTLTGGDDGAKATSTALSPARHFCRLELDLNTGEDGVDPTGIELEKNVPLFDELLNIVREIKAKGERA